MNTMLIGLLLGISCGIFYQLEWWILALLVFTGIYLVENLRKPILTGYVSSQVANGILTSVLSAQSLVKTIFTALIALIFGYVADIYGIGISFILVTGSLLVVLLMIQVALKRF